MDYIDRARTGRALAGRESLLRLMQDAELGKIARVFLYKFDRLGRSAETHAIVADLEELGVEVISATEGKEALSRSIQLVMAEHQSRILSERTKHSLIRRFQERTWTGGPPPYGYQVITCADGKRRLAANPHEADIVKLIFKHYLCDTVGVKEIARRLHHAGWPTRLGAPWSFTMVRSVLVNRVLIGEVRYLKRSMRLNKQTGRRQPRQNASANHLLYVDAALRIVSDDDFNNAQSKLAARARNTGAARAGRGVRPFTGLLFCADCGSVFYAQKSTNGDYHYYGCGNRQRNGKSVCGNTASLREDRLLSQISDVFKAIFSDGKEAVAAIASELSAAISSDRERLGRIKQEVASIEKTSLAFGRLLVDPEIEQDAKKALSRQMADAERRRAELQGQVEALADAANATSSRVIEYAFKVFDEAQTNFSKLGSPSTIHNFMEACVGRITVTTKNEMNSQIAATGLHTVHLIRSLFWTRFRTAA